VDSSFHVSAKGVLCEHGRLLLIQYREPGEAHYHYNLPGGRIRRNERAPEACKRKMLEEAGADVDVLTLLFCYEYIGQNHGCLGGDKHSISLVFSCRLRAGSEPSMLSCARPDEIQTGVCWVPLQDLSTLVLYPSCREQIITALRDPSAVQDRYWGDIF
jgi:8-oxo-dGTP diphosphatase